MAHAAGLASHLRSSGITLTEERSAAYRDFYATAIYGQYLQQLQSRATVGRLAVLGLEEAPLIDKLPSQLLQIRSLMTHSGHAKLNFRVEEPIAGDALKMQITMQSIRSPFFCRPPKEGVDRQEAIFFSTDGDRDLVRMFAGTMHVSLRLYTAQETYYGSVLRGLGSDFRVVDADAEDIKRLQTGPSSRRTDA